MHVEMIIPVPSSTFRAVQPVSLLARGIGEALHGLDEGIQEFGGVPLPISTRLPGSTESERNSSAPMQMRPVVRRRATYTCASPRGRKP